MKFELFSFPIGCEESVVEKAHRELCEYIEASVPILRMPKDLLPKDATAALIHHPRSPQRDYIVVQEGLPLHMETCVLAHELGHLENSRQDKTRFMIAMLQNMLARKPSKSRYDDFFSEGIGMIGGKMIVEEEMIANRRGRRHIEYLLPELLIDYDIMMEFALDKYRRLGWLGGDHYQWLTPPQGEDLDGFRI